MYLCLIELCLYLHLSDLAIPPHTVREAGWLIDAHRAFPSTVCTCVLVFLYLHLCDLAIPHSEEKLAGAPCATSSLQLATK